MLTLVTGTVGRTGELQTLIESLSLQIDQRFELILVDQNEDERVAPMVEGALKQGMALTWIRLGIRGTSVARNRGLQAARGTIVGFPDDDCWYEPDVVSQVLSAFADGQGRAVVGRWVERPGEPKEEKKITGDQLISFRGHAVNSNTLFVSRDLVEGAGGFDERLGIGAWFGAAEETDLVLRLAGLGADIRFNPAVRVHHPYRKVLGTGISGAFSAARRRARGTGGIYAKHKMALWVLMRGLAGPLVRAIVRLGHPAEAAAQFGDLAGRVEGYVRWVRDFGFHESGAPTATLRRGDAVK